jgi:hypothetical protein
MFHSEERRDFYKGCSVMIAMRKLSCADETHMQNFSQETARKAATSKMEKENDFQLFSAPFLTTRVGQYDVCYDEFQRMWKETVMGEIEPGISRIRSVNVGDSFVIFGSRRRWDDNIQMNFS